MDLRSQVKHVLRMCGHAMVSTVHDRLNAIDRALQDILDQNSHIASTQTALLQSSVHLVQSLARLQAQIHRIEARVAALPPGDDTTQTDIQNPAKTNAGIRQGSFEEPECRALAEPIADLQETLAQIGEHLLPTGEAAAAALQSGVERMVNISEAMRDTTAARLARLEPIAHGAHSVLAVQSVRQVCVETSDYLSTNPELGFLSFLYSYLSSRTVLDIGAHTGEFSSYLLDAGYEVYAFEPYGDSYNRLVERLGGRPEFHPSNFALGNTTGEVPLYLARDHSPDQAYEDPTVFHSLAQHGMPPGLVFDSAIPVSIRRLSDLHKEGFVPASVGLVKIDTEGYDLEVIRGMGDYRYPVVMVEFWDAGIPFATQGLRYTLGSMVREMRQRGYLWYVVIYRVWGQNQIAYFCNHDRPVPGSWGNILFFQHHETFVEAQQWLSAVLPRTYFKHVAADPQNLSQKSLRPLRAGSRFAGF